MRAVILLTCLAVAATPALHGQAGTLPPIVRAGFEAYKGPVYVRFDCYMPKDQWIVTAFLFNTKPELILPTKMMSH